MGQRPANPPMTSDEMCAANAEKRNTRLYDGAGGDIIPALISTTAAELAAMPRISLNDTETVRGICYDYMRSCEQAGVIPSKIGLSRALGVSRQGVDDFIKRKPEHETSRFLTIAFDSFSEILTGAALNNACNPILSIFISKAIYHYRDNTIIEIAGSDRGPLGVTQTAEEIAARYAELPDD